MKKSQGDRVSVPSRGFCFLGEHYLEKARVTGSAFLEGAFFYAGYMVRTEMVRTKTIQF